MMTFSFLKHFADESAESVIQSCVDEQHRRVDPGVKKTN